MKKFNLNARKIVCILTCLTMLGGTNCSNSKGENPPNPNPEPEYSKDVMDYNYSVGTQTIKPSYGFTSDSRLVETAKKILEMGSNILKIDLATSQYNLPPKDYFFSHELLEKESSFKAVLEMDFKYFLFWVYAPKVNLEWKDGLSQTESDNEYENMYKLTEYLLKTFSGTGKEFYLGHWEGDWHLTDTNSAVETLDPQRVQGMIDWYNIRQKAIDEAKAANSSDVKVYQYSEVNRVLEALDDGFERITNKILAHVNVDYVSYSSYDATQNTTSYQVLKDNLFRALNYIEANLPAKPSITGKRVFLGEYGYPNMAYSEDQQNDKSTMVIKASLEWGCPFILYWEMYNNEIQIGGTQIGYWLINNKGVKQKIYYTHEKYLREMKKYVNDFKTERGRLPSREEFNPFATSKL